MLARKLRPTAMLIYTVPTLYFYARTYVGFPTGHVRVGPTTAPLEAREFRLLTKPELDSVDWVDSMNSNPLKVSRRQQAKTTTNNDTNVVVIGISSLLLTIRIYL